MTRGIRLLGFTALLMIAALVLFMSATDTRATPPPFNPGGQICFDNLDTAAECDGDSSAGAASDISSRFCVGWGDACANQPVPANIDESNFGAVAALVPQSFIPTSAATAPVGAIAGFLTANSVLGLLNGPCSSEIQVSFSLMVGSTNTGDTISPKPVGQSNPAEPLALDVQPANGIPDGADRYPSYLNTFFEGSPAPRARLFGVSKIQGGWVTLNFMFFDPGSRVVVHSSSGAIAADTTFDPGLGLPSITVLGDPSVSPSPGAISDFCAPLRSQNVTLGKTYNNPCSPLPSPAGANCPGPVVRENAGYPFIPCETGNSYDEDGDGKINDGCPQVLAVAESGAQCDNNTSDDPEDSSVNDGCPANGDPEASRIGTCSGTDEGNCVIRQNPDAGAYTFTIAAGSQRDADSDGIENGLDVCSLDFNPDWNPHILTTAQNLNEDNDGDGLPNACDPAPEQKSGPSPLTCVAGIVGDDEDKDCFANRADNCPNDNQLKDPETAPDPTENVPDIVDSDGDGIGDACDPNPNDVNGENIGYCIEFTLTVGSPPVPVTGVRDPVLAPECVGQSVTPAPVTQTPPPGATPVTGSGGGGGTTTTGGGVGGTGSTGVGSLSPTNAGIPIWAAVLAAIGGIGLLAGFGMLRRSHAKRRIE